MHEFLEWLGSTPWSVALIESMYVWPLIESTHVLTLMLFAGMAITMDLRLLGAAFQRIPASEFTRRLLPWIWAGFVVMVITGVLLFYSAPARYYHNIFFRIKVVFLIAAGINVFLFHTRIYRRIAEWDLKPIPPQAARVAAVVSLVAWATIIVTGRMIAYNWFDCDIQPQPAWVNWLADCVIPGE